ncbi:MAG: isoaspartyl peptidase/L-asparaginase [Caulobacterales bacterium]|nr:isoaspartyl peptidase/L-asparaginase [Caulobacterales bacterium]
MRQAAIGLVMAAAMTTSAGGQDEPASEHWALAIHGGAGVITRAALSPEREARYRAALTAAAQAGADILREGGSSLDAVEAAVRLMEDEALFNAGKGAVFTAEGANELDASIMSGESRAAGAVAGVRTVKNPISLARAVMERSPHVLLSGAGAEEFAATADVEIVDPDYFYTEERWRALQERKSTDTYSFEKEDEHGTVGAVALDRHGHVAAATSTGGMTGKAFGRVGDSPIIGAGTYAEDGACAVSATGWGEYFIRASVARMICARVSLAGETLQEAADAVIAEVGELGGTGGVIVVGPEGEPLWSFNTEGMYRARVTAGTPVVTGVYGGKEE